MRRKTSAIFLFVCFQLYANVSFSQQTCSEGMNEVSNNSNNNIMKAVVVGATGATGRQVVKTLLNRNWHVTAISRRPFQHEEEPDPSPFTQIISSLSTEDVPTLTDSLRSHDALFNCLGTTRGQAGSAEAFVAVEVGLTETISEIASNAGIKHVGVVSAQGANKDMWVPTTLIHPMLYVRTLGEKEEAVLSHKFSSITIFRPGMLNRLTGDRGWENFVNTILPSAGLRVDTLAMAMVLDAEAQLSEMISNKIDENTEPSSRVRYIVGNSEIREASTGGVN